MEQQEQQIALLRERVLRLEGGGDESSQVRTSMGHSSVDDFSIKVRQPTLPKGAESDNICTYRMQVPTSND